MCQNLLSHWGTPQERLHGACAALRRGNGIIIVDDEARENEGDLIFPASTLNTAQMAMLIRECSGIVCLCLTQEKAEELELPQMVRENTSTYGTAFTVSIEAASGVTTGVSAADRLATVRAAIADGAAPSDLHRPGHVFPLVAKRGGVLQRPGHTEATVDIMRIAGLPPQGVLCELTNPDGTMRRLPQIRDFALEQDIPVLAVQDIVAFRQCGGEA